jgi:molecular chaperone DnaJ
MPRDFYEVLGVEKGADESAIKKAYRQMAMKFHPDKNPGDKQAEERFKEAAEAYSVLSDPDKRARYDRFGHAGVGGPGGFGGGGFHDVGDIFSAFGDIFGDIFGSGAGMGMGTDRGRRGRRPTRGADLRYVLDIELKDVLKGTKKEIDFESEESCKKCAGVGGTGLENCKTCGGRGQVVRQQGFFTMATTCGTCRGEGQIIKEKCTECRGRGRKSVKRKVAITVPPGVETGTQLRLNGEGEAGYFGGPQGDLYVQVSVRDDRYFERDGQNLHVKASVSYLQALLGSELEVDTLEDEVATIEVPPGTQSGDVLAIPGQGLPSLRSQRRGDLLVHVKVEFPKKLSKKEDELLRQIAEDKGLKVAKKKGLFS